MAELTQAAASLQTIPDPGRAKRDGKPGSAVLVPLYQGPSGPELVLTRRSWQMRSHRGEISFPGGRHEPADATLVDTALRESHEEIDLDPDLVTPLGRLDGLTTVSSPAPIVPILGLLERRPTLRANPAEVDGILFIPVAELWDPMIYREEIWNRSDSDLEVTFFELNGDTLWGATGRIIRAWFAKVAQ